MKGKKGVACLRSVTTAKIYAQTTVKSNNQLIAYSPLRATTREENLIIGTTCQFSNDGPNTLA